MVLSSREGEIFLFFWFIYIYFFFQKQSIALKSLNRRRNNLFETVIGKISAW